VSRALACLSFAATFWLGIGGLALFCLGLYLGGWARGEDE
jgi:hypothetical protein